MSTPRLNKKLIFLHYKDNKLWKKQRNGQAVAGASMKAQSAIVDKLLGERASSNIARWKSDPDEHPNFDRGKWSNVISKELLESSRLDLFDNNVRSYEFGEILGLSRSACKYLVDANYLEHHDMINSIVYDKSTVDSLIDSLAGIYELILDVPGQKHCYVASLQIRYYLPVDIRSKYPRYRVRCKMNILRSHEGSMATDEGIVEYDGYLSYQQSHMYFIFESRMFQGSRRLITLSFGGVPQRVDGKAYHVGGYLRSEPLNAASKSVGTALLRPVVRMRGTIRPETDLTTVIEDTQYESHMQSIPMEFSYDSVHSGYGALLST